jgi:hypothetical protein
MRSLCSAGSNVFDDRGQEADRAMPTIDLTNAELAAVTEAIRRAVEEDTFPRALRLDPLRSALAKLDPATARAK